MSHTYEKLSSNKAKLTFVVPAETFDEALSESFRKNRNRLNVPGFRRGKAPRKMIETLYGESIFYDDAFDAIFPDVYRAAIEEEKLEPVAQPKLNSIEQIGAGQDLKFDIEVFVKPDVELGEYKGLEVEITRQQLTDEMINARIKQDQDKASRTIDVEDRPVVEGDTVTLDYAGTVDGVAFEGGTAENQDLKIGSNTFIPGFEEQIVGMNIGEEKDLNVTFPEDYHAEDLAGKDAVFHVKINGIETVEVPELNDDFAADVSEFDTFDEYKADIVKKLTEQVDKNNDIQAENALVQKAVENATIDIPDAMIDSEVEYLIDEMRYQMMAQGIELEQYLKYFGMTMDSLKASRREEAKNRVRTNLVMEAIRKAENVEPTEEDIEEATKEQAEAMGEDLEDFKNRLTDGQKEYLKDSAATRMVLNLIKADAKILEKKPEEKTEDAVEEAADTEDAADAENGADATGDEE